MRSIPAWWAAMSSWDFWAAYESGAWEPETRLCIHDYVTPGSTYVDLGSWIGPTVLWAAPLAGRVVAVEPDPIAQQMLAQNVAEFTNVEIVRAAVADHTGTDTLAPIGNGFGSAMSRLVGDGLPDGGWHDWDLAGVETVKTFTVPDLFTEYRIENVSLVKMDIEGAEAEILETVGPYLQRLGIPLLVSMHPDWHATFVEPSWFDCWSEVVGEIRDTAPVLCLP